MASPVVCERCGTRNGLLADECRHCGFAISRDGSIARVRVPGGSVPSAAWETEPVPDIWRATEPIEPEREELSAHDFFRYALLLKAMRLRFEEEDAIAWFDDALFFLRGGYEFFCYLNLSSRMTMRARIFGGLNHGRRPAQRLTDWFVRFVGEARARGVQSLDVFVAEEVNSGSSAHRTMNVLRDALKVVPPGDRVVVDFNYYLACTDESVFDVDTFRREVEAKREFEGNGVVIRNVFRLFRGPILSYDEEKYSGLRKVSVGGDPVEQYRAVRYRASTFHLTCPDTHEQPLWVAPGMNDVDNFAGVLVLNLLGVGEAIAHRITEERLERQSCAICKDLFRELRAPPTSWCDEIL